MMTVTNTSQQMPTEIMELLNTLIIDPASPTHQQDFKTLIHNNQFIVFVGIGSTDQCNQMMQRADELADGSPGNIPRKVVWIPNQDVLKDDSLAFLKTFEGFSETDYPNVIAYVISPKWHEAKFLIKSSDTVDDLLISKAFWKASLRERTET